VPTIRLLLVDDHQVVRESLRRCLADDGFEIVGEGGDGRQAIELADELAPDAILMDVSMPRTDGIDATREIKARHAEVAVVMLTQHAEQSVFTAAQRAGADSYLVKDASVAQVAQAVRLSTRGDSVWPRRLGTWALDDARSRARPAEGLGHGGVTRREREVLQLVADGCSTTEVAGRLFISQKTVKNHLASAYHKLGVPDRTQALLEAVRRGMVQRG
jgi:two-component system response regulator DegU